MASQLADINSIKFHDEPSVIVSSLDEARDHVNIFTGFESMTEVSHSAQLNDDATFTVAGVTKELTRTALARLCKTLKIPDPFAARIPFGLLQENINQLLHRDQLLTSYAKEGNNHWVNFNPKTGGEFSLIELLEAIDEEGFVFTKGELTEAEVNIAFLTEAIPPAIDKLEVGSITKFGYNLRASESGFVMPMATAFAYRLVCMNGAVAPISFGKAKMKKFSDGGVPNFLNNWGELVSGLQSYAEVYRRVATSPENVPPIPLFATWKAVSKVLRSKDGADQLLGMEESARNGLRAAARYERLMRNAVDLGDIDDDDSSDAEEYTPIESPVRISWFALANKLTSGANVHRSTARRRLQTLGGHVLETAFRSIGRN